MSNLELITEALRLLGRVCLRHMITDSNDTLIGCDEGCPLFDQERRWCRLTNEVPANWESARLELTNEAKRAT